MHPVMNDTKWGEIRLAMYELGDLSPKWRTLDLENGQLSAWDGEWFYHFSVGGYRTIQWLEVKVATDEQRDAVRAALARIHVPGESTENGFKIYGYVTEDQSVDYLRAL
jgi:hypothetical protein